MKVEHNPHQCYCTSMKKQTAVLFSPMVFSALLALVLFLTSCAPSANVMEDVANPANQSLAGFWLGLWHGFIATFMFVVSWFTDAVNVYEIHNNGGWYNFGFLIGVGGFAKGSSSAVTTRR